MNAPQFNPSELPRRNRRRSYNGNIVVISGETTTLADAATRLGLTKDQFHSRRKYAIKKMQPGEVLTWEMLTR